MAAFAPAARLFLTIPVTGCVFMDTPCVFCHCCGYQTKSYRTRFGDQSFEDWIPPTSNRNSIAVSGPTPAMERSSSLLLLEIPTHISLELCLFWVNNRKPLPPEHCVLSSFIPLCLLFYPGEESHGLCGLSYWEGTTIPWTSAHFSIGSAPHQIYPTVFWIYQAALLLY